jgi:hypothetical protein
MPGLGYAACIHAHRHLVLIFNHLGAWIAWQERACAQGWPACCDRVMPMFCHAET